MFTSERGMQQGAPQGGTLLPGPPDMLCVRIVSIDYYLTQPVPGLDVCFSHLEGSAVERVPVIRIFGSTPAGQKACVHVHKVSLLAALLRI